MRKIISIILALIVVLSCLSSMNLFVSADEKSGYDGGVFFGHYFQNEVTDQEEIEMIEKSQMKAGVYLCPNGKKYAYKYNKEDGTEHYFSYDPIEWQIVGEEQGCYVLLSKYILFTRYFTDYSSDGDCFYSEGKFRKMLNGEFLDSAFTSSEQREMSSGYYNEESENPFVDENHNPYNTELEGDLKTVRMNDKVSIPSEDDVLTNYTLSSLYAGETDYTKIDSEGNSYWLRGPSYWHYAVRWFRFVNSDEEIYCTFGNLKRRGVRPVIKVKKNANNLLFGDPTTVNRLNLDNFRITTYDKEPFSTVKIGDEVKTNAEIKGARYVIGNEKLFCPSSSSVTDLPYSRMGTGTIFIDKDDYQQFKIPKEVSKNWKGKIDTFNAYMSKDKKDGKPYISSVFVKDEDNSNDVYKEVRNEKVTVYKDNTYKIIVSAVGADKGAKYVIAQNDKNKIVSNSKGVFVDKIAEKFDRNLDTYVYIKNSDGQTSEPVKINLSFTDLDDTSNNFLSKSNFKLIGDKWQTIKLADDLPVFGGQELTFKGLKLPMGVEIEGNKVKVSLGFNIFNKENKDGKTEEKWLDFKESVGTLVDEMQKGMDTYKKFKTVRDTFSVADSFTSKKIGTSIDFLGYIEGQIVGNKFIMTEINGAVSTEISIKFTEQGVVGAIPSYMYVEAALEIGAAVKRARLVADEEVPLNLDVTLDVEPSLKIGVGVGIKDAISAGAYGKASLPYQLDFGEMHRKMSLKGELGVEGEIFILKGEKTVFEGTRVLLDDYFGNKTTKDNKYSTGSGVKIDNSGEMSIMSRSYLKNSYDYFSKNKGKMKKLTGSQPNSINAYTLKSSIFENSQAKIIKYGDKAMAVWVDDDADRDTYNRLCLMYSICDLKTKLWSQPKAVDNDGKLESYPYVFGDGNDIYIAWQNIKSKMDKNSLNEKNLLQSSEIKIAKYNSDNDSFETRVITDNNTYDYLPCGCINNGKAEFYWVNDSSCSFSKGKSTIYKYDFDTKEVTSVNANLNYIPELVVYDGNVAYTMDSDGDITTSNDTYLYKNNEKYNLNNEDKYTVTGLYVSEFEGKKSLFASDSNFVYNVTGDKAVSMFSSTAVSDGNFQIVDCGGTYKALWTKTDGEKSDVYISEYKDGKWTEAVKLFASDGIIKNFVPVYYDKDLTAVYNNTKMKVSTNTSGEKTYEKVSTDFNYMTAGEFSDVEIAIPFINESNFVKGEETFITTVVTNNGTQPVSSLLFTIDDGIGEKTTWKKDISIESGESVNVDVPYTVSEDFDKTNLTISASVDGDVNSDNDSVTKDIGSFDIVVSDVNVEDVGNYYGVSAIVSNESAVPTENVDVKLMCGDRILNTESYSRFPGKEANAVQFFVEKDKLTYTDNISELKVVASASENENNEDNNTVKYLLEKATDSSKPFDVNSITIPEDEVLGDSSVFGDVNNDHNVDIRDATIIQLHLVCYRELTGRSLRLADYNKDGSVNINDVTAIQKKVIGITE